VSAAENTEPTDSVAEILAALVNGDRWLCAGAGAAYLGQMPKKTFLAFACQPGFPVALRVGKRRMWRKSELDEWAERQRAVQSRQRAA
jgi:predicted DNA-binding transcriptional regulator AlpA